MCEVEKSQKLGTTSMRNNKQGEDSWAVVGGGLCGMVAALRLAESGKKVHLFEAANSLGGLARAWKVGGVVWDQHYHVTLLSDSFTLGLLRELNLESSMRWSVTRTGYYSEGALVSISNSWEYLKLPGLSLVDKARLAWTILYASKIRDASRLDQVAVEDWLRKHSGAKVLNRFWRPLLRAKLGDEVPRCSAAFLWATIRRLYAARESGLKVEKFGYLQGGYATLHEKLAAKLEQLNVDIHLGAPVASVASKEGMLRLQVKAQKDVWVNQAIVTLPPKQAAKICIDLSPAERKQLESVEYQGLLCASLLLKRPLADFYLTYLVEDNMPFTAVVEMTSMVDPVELDGFHLVYLPLYLSPSDPRFSMAEHEIQEMFVEGLKKIHPHFSSEDMRAFRLSRVAEVFPLPLLNSGEQDIPLFSSVEGLCFMNSAQIHNGTLNANETIALAEKSVQELV